MGTSVGNEVKIPIVSTFDPSGIVAAKAGMKELSQTKTSSSGGGESGGASGGGASSASRSSAASEADSIFEKTRTANEKYEYQVRKLDDLHKRGAISSDTYRRAQKQAADGLPKAPGLGEKLGIGQAGQTLANQFGLGGVTSAMGAGGIVAGAALAGVAIYGLTQKVAGEAVALREHARALNVSTTYYAGLTAAAHKAGVSVETVTEGLTGMHSLAGGALTGDIGAALFLRSMGIGRSDLESGYEDTQGMSRKMLAAAKTPGQQATLFGSVAAANAIGTANTQEQPWHTPTTGEARAASGLAADAWGLGVKAFGVGMMDLKWLTGGGTFAEQEKVASAQEAKEQEGKLQGERTKIGMQTLPGLLNPEELAEQKQAAGQGIFDEFGPEGKRYAALHTAQIHAQRTASESSLMRPRELQERELDDWKEKSAAGGFSNQYQASAAGIQIREKADAGLSGVRSNRENLAAAIDRGAERWDNAARNGGDFGAASSEKEQRDIARDQGDKLTDYAESITKSGSLAGAYDMNSVAGYSQQVGAEYQMSQSQDTLKMVELLTQIAEHTGHMTTQEGAAVRNNLGFRTNGDPFNIFGGD